jgi:hypothetical protein
MPFRDGFDVTTHPFSFLLIGSPGWMQSIVFVVAGVLFAAAGAGLLAVVGRRVGRVAFAAAVGLGVGETGTAWLVFIAAAALPGIPATSGAPFGTVLLYAVAISAYLATSAALLRIAKDSKTSR